ncbi:MAG: transcriptional regulator [Lachnospiraceae bacterium]|nr:transcriptional regulator [Lachnospiraceae bacterium]
MGCYTIGELIRDTRERRKLSQEDVCFGICMPSTLSRIENGQQVPGRKILEGLMQRLGIEWMFDVSMSRKEGEKYELEQEMLRCVGKKEYDRASALADELEERLKKDANREYLKLEEQYLSFIKSVIRKDQGENLKKVLEQLLKAIRMTIPDFDGLHIQLRLLTCQEISILNSIGCIYHSQGKLWDALRLLFDLKECMEHYKLNGQRISEKYPMILQNLSTWMEQEGYYREALKLCQKGIDFCVEYGKMHTFPMLLCNKACALAELGQIEMSKEIFYQSITILEAVGQQESAEQVRRYARHFGI